MAIIAKNGLESLESACLTYREIMNHNFRLLDKNRLAMVMGYGPPDNWWDDSANAEVFRADPENSAFIYSYPDRHFVIVNGLSIAESVAGSGSDPLEGYPDYIDVTLKMGSNDESRGYIKASASASETIKFAFDKNTSTQWALYSNQATTPMWVFYAFKDTVPRKIECVEISYTYDHRLPWNQISVMGSNDATTESNGTWTTIATSPVIGDLPATDGVYTFTFTNNTAYKVYKLSGPPYTSVPYLGAKEIKFMSRTETTTLVSKTPVYTNADWNVSVFSNVYRYSNYPYLCMDGGDENTGWSADPNNALAWIAFKFKDGVAKCITAFASLAWSGEYLPWKRYTVLGSNDTTNGVNGTWFTVYDTPADVAYNSLWYSVQFTNTEKYLWYKITGTTPSGGTGGTSLSSMELSVFGPLIEPSDAPQQVDAYVHVYDPSYGGLVVIKGNGLGFVQLPLAASMKGVDVLVLAPTTATVTVSPETGEKINNVVDAQLVATGTPKKRRFVSNGVDGWFTCDT